MSAAPRLQSASPFVHVAAVLALAPGGARVDPRLELRRRELVEEQQQVGEVALGVDRDHGDALPEQLLQHHDRETGLSGPGHPDDHPVGQQVVGIELEGGAGLAAVGVDPPADIQPLGHASEVYVGPPAIMVG